MLPNNVVVIKTIKSLRNKERLIRRKLGLNLKHVSWFFLGCSSILDSLVRPRLFLRSNKNAIFDQNFDKK